MCRLLAVCLIKPDGLHTFNPSQRAWELSVNVPILQMRQLRLRKILRKDPGLCSPLSDSGVQNLGRDLPQQQALPSEEQVAMTALQQHLT